MTDPNGTVVAASDGQPTRIGYVPLVTRSSSAFPVPRTVRTGRDRPLSRRAVQACPVVNTLERRLIESPAPFSLGLRSLRNHRGGYDLPLLDETIAGPTMT